MFGLKFRGEANVSVVMLKPFLNACMYLSGVVHWCASLLLLLPSVGLWCICPIGVQWLLESPDDHNVCVFQVGAIVNV